MNSDLNIVGEERISVIIPTYNGKAHLQEVISRLLIQTNFQFEIIVVDDGSTIFSPSDWQLISDLSKSIKIVHQPNKGRAAARNFGVKNSNGNILIFLDDDIYVSETFVANHVSFHLNHSPHNPAAAHQNHQTLKTTLW